MIRCLCPPLQARPPRRAGPSGPIPVPPERRCERRPGPRCRPAGRRAYPTGPSLFQCAQSAGPLQSRQGRPRSPQCFVWSPATRRSYGLFFRIPHLVRPLGSGSPVEASRSRQSRLGRHRQLGWALRVWLISAALVLPVIRLGLSKWSLVRISLTELCAGRYHQRDSDLDVARLGGSCERHILVKHAAHRAQSKR